MPRPRPFTTIYAILRDFGHKPREWATHSCTLTGAVRGASVRLVHRQALTARIYLGEDLLVALVWRGTKGFWVGLGTGFCFLPEELK